MNGILTTLEREWDYISSTPRARRAARQWATVEPVLDAASPGDLVNRLRAGPSHHGAQVAVNALARLAAQGDTLAARTALQIALPVVFQRTMRAMAAVGYSKQLQAESQAEAVTAAVDRISRLPSQPTRPPCGRSNEPFGHACPSGSASTTTGPISRPTLTRSPNQFPPTSTTNPARPNSCSSSLAKRSGRA